MFASGNPSERRQSGQNDFRTAWRTSVLPLIRCATGIDESCRRAPLGRAPLSFRPPAQPGCFAVGEWFRLSRIGVTTSRRSALVLAVVPPIGGVMASSLLVRLPRIDPLGRRRSRRQETTGGRGGRVRFHAGVRRRVVDGG